MDLGMTLPILILFTLLVIIVPPLLGLVLQIWVLQQVHPHVLVQIAPLGEFILAAQLVLEWALKGTLICVHPNVIVEIVALPEGHVATGEVALDDLKVAHGNWVLVLEYPEESHVLVDLIIE